VKKNKILPISASILIVLGLWITLVPFSRPLPGGEIFSFESTPEASCRSPIFGTFIEDSPSYEVYIDPKPKIGDPTVSTSVSCSGRATFRFIFGFSFFLLGTSLMVYYQRYKKWKT
jgi:hypothetical protein